MSASISFSRGINIMPAAGLPAFVSGFSFSSAVHVLERYNSDQATGMPEGDELGEDAAIDFGQDFESGKAAPDGWPATVFESPRYHPELFLETLYFGVFQIDFLMQNVNADRELYMPVRNDCIQALGRHLVDGLGYRERINQIYRTLAERAAGYGRDRIKSPILFAANVLKLTPRPEVFSVRASAYLSLGALKTFVPLFINRAPNGKDIHIQCRKCRKTIAPVIDTTPAKIRCRGCLHEYLVAGVWTTT